MVESRVAWWLLAGSALALEGAALWFQYVMELDPCVMCIYERVALLGIVLAGLLGSIYPAWLPVRLLGYLAWGISAIWGLLIAAEHVGIQLDQGAALSCAFAPDFPAWARLDEWLPALFLPTGYCDEVQWRWLSLSMVEWVLLIFVGYLMTLSGMLYWEIRRRRVAR